jgi:hypothetical protein
VQKATVDQPVTHPHGDLLITTALVETGVHFYVSDGVQRIDELTKTFADRDQAKAYYLHVAHAAEQGKRIHQIVWEVQALEEAQNAATGRTPEQVRADLNTDGAVYVKAETAARDQLAADTAAIMADADPNWRANLRKQVVQAAEQRNGYVGARPIDHTRTQVHLKPLTAVELDLIRSHIDGTVRTRPGQAWTVLRAIVRRGYGNPVYGTGRRIAAVQLNQRGLNAAQQTERAA